MPDKKDFLVTSFRQSERLPRTRDRSLLGVWSPENCEKERGAARILRIVAVAAAGAAAGEDKLAQKRTGRSCLLSETEVERSRCTGNKDSVEAVETAAVCAGGLKGVAESRWARTMAGRHHATRAVATKRVVIAAAAAVVTVEEGAERR